MFLIVYYEMVTILVTIFNTFPYKLNIPILKKKSSIRDGGFLTRVYNELLIYPSLKNNSHV